ncbi:protein PSK SIMULATOR 1-like [Populus nigra]|uniref:protein PSK SIMULATOR 1-like n=1 Tax=Populus nigra TaxID=3691 RepID=UPI002B266009|nr:protein PSK SIMULATOR 1-like [Populus nigra]
MGGLCSRSSTVDNAPSGGFLQLNGHFSHGSGLVFQTRELKIDGNTNPSLVGENNVDNKQLREPFSFPEVDVVQYGMNPDDIDDGIPRLSRALSNKSRSTKSTPVAVAKVSEVSSLLGRAGTVGLGKAYDVLDTLGSSMTNLNLSSGGFTSGVTTKGNKISILAFEVANTIVKGANLMQSLSKENIRHLKEVVLPSEGVQNLISRDMDELLRLAATDKREELKVFSGEVVRFGNRCKDPQWHNLDRYLEKLGSELTPEMQLKDEAETVMHQLMNLVQYTAELYHEMHALDRFEQDYRRKLQEDDKANVAQRGDSLSILRAELKSQRKHVKSLKKKSLWSKILEEVMEKLVDIVHFLHLEIHEAFGSADGDRPVKSSLNHKKLGPAGLALHYANIITQIDTLVSRSSSVPPNTRDALYQGLPPNIKSALRSKLLSFQVKEELTVSQIKAEMEKTLHWLVPIATNTNKAHHGFGWVGEWANTGSEVNRKPAGQTDLLRIETLHHADKEKTEIYILELVVWLQHLVSQVRAANGGLRSPVKSPIRSPNQKTIQLCTQRPSSPSPMLTIEDQEMLRDVSKRKKTPGISKSQEFDTAKNRLSKHHRLSKSSSHSPMGETRKDPFPIRRPSSVPVIDFDIDRMKALDVIDRVDTIRSL